MRSILRLELCDVVDGERLLLLGRRRLDDEIVHLLLCRIESLMCVAVEQKRHVVAVALAAILACVWSRA